MIDGRIVAGGQEGAEHMSDSQKFSVVLLEQRRSGLFGY